MENKHQCESRLEGDEVIMTCPLCKGYERRFNLTTNKFTVKNKVEGIKHIGMMISPSVLPIGSN